MRIRWMSGFLAVCLLLTFMPISQAAQQSGPSVLQQGDIRVDEYTFPDAAFRSWLLNGANINGVGADGVLTEEERLAVSKIDVSGQGIQSLEGIEVFTALEELNCSENELETLDVTHNTELKRLYCSYNNLRELSLENNAKLVSLSSSFNRIDVLDLSDKPALKTLNSQMSFTSQLNLTGSTALEWVNVANNQLTALDLSTNGNLTYLDVFDNQLTALDVSALSKLDFLNAGYNRLTKLDMSQNQSFSSYGGFFATDNYLEELTLPNQENFTVSFDRFATQLPVTGYDAVTWYLDDAYTQPVEGDLPAEGQTIYARRNANSYRIYFSSNYGNGEMPALSAIYDQEVSLPEAAFTRYGHTFVGWNTMPRGGGDAYADQQTVLNLAGKWDGAKITLYAQWKPNEYSIVFDANDPSAAGQMDGVAATYGSSVQLPANGFALAGKEFAGWALQPDGPVRYRDAAAVQNLSAEAGSAVTLYAVWRTPIADIQSPYLEKLEQEFQTYSSENYTVEDWTALSGAYTSADSLIRGTDVAEEMEAYSSQAIAQMEQVSDRQERLEEIAGGWQAANREILDALGKGSLSEQNAAQLSELASTALAGLTNEQLAQFSGLTQAEDLEQIVGEARNQLNSEAAALEALIESANWLMSLDGMSTQPLAQVTSEHAGQYHAKWAEYEALTSEQQAQIAPEVRAQLEQRKLLAGQKKSAVSELQTFYRSFALEALPSHAQEVLVQALERGVAGIESADSAEAVQTALRQGQEALEQASTSTPTPAPTAAPTATPKPPTGGGGGGISTYAVNVQDAANGSVTANPTRAAKGAKVTLQAAPRAGYALTALTVTDARGNEISVTDAGEGRYTFTMPASRVDVQAEFEWINPFTDVDSGAWYYRPIAHGVSSGWFAGVDGQSFLPDGAMTRAMLATVLYRAAGEPELEARAATEAFDDVDPESWYGPAVYWAQQMGIVVGTGDGRFEPEGHITREQLAAMLHRYAGTPEANGSLEDFVDASQAAEFAVRALHWAVGQGVMSGKGGGVLDPKGMATRAQVAQMMMNLKDMAAQ